MKNPLEILRMKEQELARIKKEVEALRIAVRLLAEEGDQPADLSPDNRKIISMP
jgi:hypothetical protein